MKREREGREARAGQMPLFGGSVPIPAWRSVSDTMLSVLAKPFVAIEGAEHVALFGLAFQDARGNGVEAKDGSDYLVAGNLFLDCPAGARSAGLPLSSDSPSRRPSRPARPAIPSWPT